MALYKYGSSSKATSSRTGMSEFEILKTAHRFLRDEEDPKGMSWEDQLAVKYYSSLYREFAVCDLKHYKSGNFALRWRTEDEVLSGAGETTCGNTRCDYHHSPPDQSSRPSSIPPLTTLELPFSYVERGETMSALVKVVLCPKCVKKLMYQRRKEKGEAEEQEGEQEEARDKITGNEHAKKANRKEADEGLGEGSNLQGKHSKRRERHRDRETRRRNSRSRSPTRGINHSERAQRRERSP